MCRHTSSHRKRYLKFHLRNKLALSGQGIARKIESFYFLFQTSMLFDSFLTKNVMDYHTDIKTYYIGARAK